VRAEQHTGQKPEKQAAQKRRFFARSGAGEKARNEKNTKNLRMTGFWYLHFQRKVAIIFKPLGVGR
jgi:hypothetical protein